MKAFLTFVAVVCSFGTFVYMYAGVHDPCLEQQAEAEECDHGLAEGEEPVVRRPKATSRPIVLPSEESTAIGLNQKLEDIRLCRLIEKLEGSPTLGIKRGFWKDVSLPGEKYEQVSDFYYAIECCRRYWARYGAITDEQKVRMHRSGPSGMQRLEATERWETIKRMQGIVWQVCPTCNGKGMVK